MSVPQTKAALQLQENAEELTAHQVISLLMDGALERVGQAQESVKKGQMDDAAILVTKLVGIINGLRSHLNFDAGGEIAVNLGALYNYMVELLAETGHQDEAALAEVQQLIGQLKSGWDAIDGEMSEAS